MKSRFLLLCLSVIILVGCGSEPDAAATPSPATTATVPPPTAPAEVVSTSTPVIGAAATPLPEATLSLPDNSHLPPSPFFTGAWEERSIYASTLIGSEQDILSGLPGATVYHLEIEIDESLLALRGREAVLYTNRADVSLNEIYLRLFPNIFGGSSTVSEVQVNDQPVTPALELNDSALRIPLEPALSPGEQVVIRLTFDLTVPTTPAGNYGAYATINNVMALAHFYPMVSVYDDEGWNIEIAPPAGDVVYAEASFYQVRITAPANLVLVTSGNIIEQQTVDDQQTVTAVAGPARDFYLAGSPYFVPLTGQSGESTVISYAFGEHAARGREMLDYAIYAMDLYAEMFGPYPYTELEFASTSNEALGIEYPGVFVNSMFLYTPEQEISVPDSYYMESTTVHETSHQWFYNVVGNDQLDEPWLDEALAQYATYLYFLDRYGAEGAEQFYSTFILRWERGSNNADIPIGLPVSSYVGPEYSGIIYGRGPLFFATLQEEMGAETFAAFLREYYLSFKWGIATTDGFRTLAEQHCACDLTTLFEAWIYPR